MLGVFRGAFPAEEGGLLGAFRGALPPTLLTAVFPASNAADISGLLGAFRGVFPPDFGTMFFVTSMLLVTEPTFSTMGLRLLPFRESAEMSGDGTGCTDCLLPACFFSGSPRLGRRIVSRPGAKSG